MIDVLNLALPYFGLIFIDFACGKLKQIPDTALAWMNSSFVLHPVLVFLLLSLFGPFEQSWINTAILLPALLFG
jgi:hypothetical protein